MATLKYGIQYIDKHAHDYVWLNDYTTGEPREFDTEADANQYIDAHDYNRRDYTAQPMDQRPLHYAYCAVPMSWTAYDPQDLPF